ncbi:hypothetical protein [Abiotrophia defectiva]|uniref:hypothetical protein n=1 Tax=Abiotrophia defectiva TaxID=46125 RepID=UPI0030D20FC0
MGHKKADERETVIKWLEYCHKNKRKPWLWDFKNCYKVPQSEDSLSKDSLPKDSLSEDSITAFLKYKNGEFKDTTIFNITEKAGFDADCDKEAIELYKVLGWQNSATDVIRGETMNSFLTTFNRAIRQSSNYKTLTKTLGIDNRKKERYSKLYKDQNYRQFDIIENNRPAFQTFAKLTHTIGNFTVLPHWMNTGRSNLSQDYWDIFLLSLQEWLHLISPTSEAWINFIELYYLQPYVNKDYQIEPLWKNHSYTTPILKEKEDFPIFLKAVNERIEERGKYMIKQICDRLNRTDFNFYKEIRDMDKIRFSDEF